MLRGDLPTVFTVGQAGGFPLICACFRFLGAELHTKKEKPYRAPNGFLWGRLGTITDPAGTEKFFRRPPYFLKRKEWQQQ